MPWGPMANDLQAGHLLGAHRPLLAICSPLGELAALAALSGAHRRWTWDCPIRM